MIKHTMFGSLAAFLLTGMGADVIAQDNEDGDRKVRVEITKKENGQTTRVTREFDLGDEEAMQDALRELGVFDEMNMVNDGENLVIDMKRMSDEGSMLKDMCVALAIDAEEAAGAAALCAQRAYLGVYYGNYDGEPCVENGESAPVEKGACITSVIDGTPADEAGLESGDVITALGDDKIGDGEELVEALAEHAPGDAVKLTYYRGKQKKTTELTLGENKDNVHYFEWKDDGSEAMDWEAYFGEGAWSTQAHPFLGVDGEDVPDNGGARITGVIEDTNAESMGIEEGDVIKKVNDTRIMSFTSLAEVIGEMEPGATVAIEVERDGETTTLHGTLGEQEYPMWEGLPEPPEAPEAPGAPMPYMYRIPYMEPMERQQLHREMDQLHREMDQLRRDLRGEVTREMTVVIGTVELNKEETDLLRSKGVTALDNALTLPELRCYPNPSSGAFRLEFTVPERGDLHVDVHNAHGEKVYQESIIGFRGNYERTLDLSDLADGNYYLVIAQGGKALARKLMKQ